MLGGHHPNCGLAEFCTRGRSAMNLDAIFRQNPHLERHPGGLNIFRMQHFDRLGPSQGKAMLEPGSCDLEYCWSVGIAMAEEALARFNASPPVPFHELFQRPDTDLLRPLGSKYPSVASGGDRSFGEDETSETTHANIPAYTNPYADLFTAEIVAREAPKSTQPCSAFARVDNTSERRVHKSWALRILFDMYIDLLEARDRLLRVRGFSSASAQALGR
ncbi:hypothetical protein HMN09_01388500 [Mycena chlorophos]|uniref:Uncharacterized protein n=1 Tax=Mycena chlorophos TaxID=658473 RepID=A0A8H6VP37_MYCCL|nr:hypothetical protein HMN09_01388500 [Mycena chlorophos]